MYRVLLVLCVTDTGAFCIQIYVVIYSLIDNLYSHVGRYLSINTHHFFESFLDYFAQNVRRVSPLYDRHWNFALSIQVTIQATDFGTPARSGSAVLTVNVLRNTQPPVFLTVSPSATIEQTLSVGSSVILLSAEDADTQVSFHNSTYTASSVSLLSADDGDAQISLDNIVLLQHLACPSCRPTMLIHR